MRFQRFSQIYQFSFSFQHPINFAINFIQRSAKKSKKDAMQTKEKENAEKPAVRTDEADSSRTKVSWTFFFFSNNKDN